MPLIHAVVVWACRVSQRSGLLSGPASAEWAMTHPSVRARAEAIMTRQYPVSRAGSPGQPGPWTAMIPSAARSGIIVGTSARTAVGASAIRVAVERAELAPSPIAFAHHREMRPSS